MWSSSVGDPDPQVVDHAAAGDEIVVDRLGAVAVGVEQEAAVVVRPVLRTQPGLAVVAVARVDAGLAERVDVLARRRREADVEASGRRLRGVRGREGELVPLDEPVGGVRPLEPVRAQHRVVERRGRVEVGRAEGHVIPDALRVTPDRGREPVSPRR
jgi:hypothetical protein